MGLGDLWKNVHVGTLFLSVIFILKYDIDRKLYAEPKGIELGTVSASNQQEIDLLEQVHQVLKRYPEARLTSWSDDGLFDFSAMTFKVTGVGTPLLLSPTGGLATRELGELAIKDARQRLKRGIRQLVQHFEGSLISSQSTSSTPNFGCKIDESIESILKQAQPQRFSDGSVHFQGILSLKNLACAPLKGLGEGALSFVRLQGASIQYLSQLPRLQNASGSPINPNQIRFFRDHEPTRKLLISTLKPTPRNLKKGTQSGVFVLQGKELSAQDMIWVFISDRALKLEENGH